MHQRCAIEYTSASQVGVCKNEKNCNKINKPQWRTRLHCQSRPDLCDSAKEVHLDIDDHAIGKQIMIFMKHQFQKKLDSKINI
jgi:hypothetical protein